MSRCPPPPVLPPSPMQLMAGEAGADALPLVLDTEQLRALTGDDPEFAAQLFALFQGDAPMYLNKLHQAIAANDVRDVERAAHAIQGAARAICAGGVADAARILEQAAREGLLDDANAMADALAAQLALLDDTLAHHARLAPTTFLH